MASFHRNERPGPETLVRQLKAQLGAHALWDALLVVMPPVVALLCALYLLVQDAWLNYQIASAVATLTLCLGALAVTLRYRPRLMKLSQAAQRIDQRTGAKDHFLTLATIEPRSCTEPLLSRLRQDAAALTGRVELRRDFPYRVKTSTYWSAASSLILVLALYFLLPLAASLSNPVSASQRLRELAAQMTQAPHLKELAEELNTLAAKLDNPNMQPQDKQAAVRDVQQKFEEQQKQEEETSSRDLLSQAMDELKGSEKQQAASGQGQQKSQSEGGGQLQSNLPKQGQGEGRQSQGSGAEDPAGMQAQLSQDMQQGKSSREKPTDANQDKNPQQQGGAQGNQADSKRQGKEPDPTRADKSQGESKDGGAKDQASESPPQSAPPAERFYQAGEGKDGLKSARYVTVQLPEEVAADNKGNSKATQEGTGRRGRSQVPVSNTPLPAHMPDTPTEKQPMPLEYRDIIR